MEDRGVRRAIERLAIPVENHPRCGDRGMAVAVSLRGLHPDQVFASSLEPMVR